LSCTTQDDGERLEAKRNVPEMILCAVLIAVATEPMM
jgi:hypothetical protein